MAPAETTSVTIDGSRTSLVFGYRYSVRYGDDAILRDAILDRREANGDLSFLVLPDETGANGGRRRVRPSTIDSLVGSGTEYLRRDGETAAAFLERAEAELGRWYSTWIGTDAGQAALEAVAGEDRSTRKARRAEPEKVADVLSTIYPGVVASSRSVSLDDLATELEEPLPVPSEADIEEIAALNRERRASEAKGRPYAERNQVWRCGSCKRRTRAAFCENGHPRVEAPAGKRRDAR